MNVAVAPSHVPDQLEPQLFLEFNCTTQMQINGRTLALYQHLLACSERTDLTADDRSFVGDFKAVAGRGGVRRQVEANEVD